MWLTLLLFASSVHGLGLSLFSPITPSPSSTPTPPATSTSNQWLIISNTSIFWPTSTDYFYGPTTGPQASAVSCNAAWMEYVEHITGACKTHVRREDWNDPHPNGPITTLCDGIPRALGPVGMITTWLPGTGPCLTSTKTYTYTFPIYREPSPALPFLGSNQDHKNPRRHRQPSCPLHCPTPPAPYTENPCRACHFVPADATIFYWPHSRSQTPLTSPTTPQPPFHPNTTPITTTITKTITKTNNNNNNNNNNQTLTTTLTFTSPTIYISLPTLRAGSNDRFPTQCGHNHTDVLLSVHPSTLSSVRSHYNSRRPVYGTRYPFDLADFVPRRIGNFSQLLVPWEKYRGGIQYIFLA
ncbi:hypothetical protein BO70DRAFT_399018 [Aspergillus heteromorphus CBS 117.55]|uniref:Uncharacterized protein n=1 Tax=Aspergillus heteromorphus CBS 117.55 TaxID=1448321 RepID=A0A317VIA8_9EURO|nr:uncharacterized protein BO70DRAFT_399018 [Aspergillus heteromorphus CBS 117.55]PWY72941.1 hypothetical protein BO70DRAFT_399018 [Aspergillus heteromorphus CBS 117.55]